MMVSTFNLQFDILHHVGEVDYAYFRHSFLVDKNRTKTNKTYSYKQPEESLQNNSNAKLATNYIW